MFKSLSLVHGPYSSSTSDVPEIDFVSNFSDPDLRRNEATNKASSVIRSSSSGSTQSSKKTKTCAICLGSMRIGGDKAIFKAECSHIFHYDCIAANVRHGNKDCPICRCSWQELPFLPPPPPPPFLSSNHHRYADDELISFHNIRANLHTDPPPKICLKALTEFPALSSSESHPHFAILVSVRAPSIRHFNRDRAPVDLVACIDVSGSMGGSKLYLLKRAVRFIIEHLLSCDRLSIVAFSSTARRLFPLQCMTEEGRQQALRAINKLTSGGRTNIIEGLRKGVKILVHRRQKNPVSTIFLFSDGKDTYNTAPLIDQIIIPFPVHTFGFGEDHDPISMHAISDKFGGTFSFVETQGSIQDAFARCIGGVLSVVAQKVKLMVYPNPSIIITSVCSGKYSIHVSQTAIEVEIGDLYADEEKHFLVHASIPKRITHLVTVKCWYRDPLKQLEETHITETTVTIRRPGNLTVEDQTMCLEIDKQINRVLVMEGISEAQKLAEKGDLSAAQWVLADRREKLLKSASAQAGDSLCNLLEAELKEIRQRMATKELYEKYGRAYMLSGMSSHGWQRATTRGGDSVVERKTGGGYETPSMVDMVSRSQTMEFSGLRLAHRSRILLPQNESIRKENCLH